MCGLRGAVGRSKTSLKKATAGLGDLKASRLRKDLFGVRPAITASSFKERNFASYFFVVNPSLTNFFNELYHRLASLIPPADPSFPTGRICPPGGALRKLRLGDREVPNAMHEDPTLKTLKKRTLQKNEL
jgi:hypothetical protein